MSSQRVYFRTARPEDKADVMRFTSSGFDGHTDYIEFVWPVWLKDSEGCLLVATINRQAIAIGHVARLSASESWLEGVRVDPEWRNRGIGHKFLDYCIQRSANLPTRVLRFITSANNHPVQAMAYRLGFNKILETASCEIGPLSDRSIQVEKAVQPDCREIWHLIEYSTFYQEMMGLNSLAWQISRLEFSTLERAVDSGNVFCVRSHGIIQAAAIIDPQGFGKYLVLCWAGGTPDRLETLIQYLRSWAGHYCKEKIFVRIPAGSSLVADFQHAGFVSTGDADFWIYEKPLVRNEAIGGQT
jgi:ribosomal protein S18 acetylase RimI-like enzyme